MEAPPYAPVTKFIPSPLSTRARPQHVLRAVLATSDGREVFIRAVQYVFRLYIYIRSRQRFSFSPSSASSSSSSKTVRLLFFVSVLSTVRKVLALVQHGRQIDALACPTALASPCSESLPLPSPPPPPESSSLIPEQSGKNETDNDNNSSSSTDNIKSDQEELDKEMAHEDDLETQAIRMGELGPGPGFERRWKTLHFTGSFLSLIQSVADDVECFGRLGLLPETTRRIADRIADSSWLCLTVIELVRVQSERGKCWTWGRRLRRVMIDNIEARAASNSARKSRNNDDINDDTNNDDLRQQLDASYRDKIIECRNMLRYVRLLLYHLWWNRIKLFADLIFAAYDTFDIRPANEGVRAFSGALSAIIGFKQVYQETKHALLNQV